MQNIECEHCGGTDFYKEAGFYYCSGCQTQSQEVQEYVFDDLDGEDQHRLSSKKLQSDKSEKADNKITSWECYNYILLGLTNELINLGADKRLKATVRNLWMLYLEKLQVFKRGKDELPKLQAVNSTKDAEIVYGKPEKKKRKREKSSDDTNVMSLDASSLRRERSRKKRALAEAQYEDFTQQTQSSTNLHNETLTSLQTGSEKSSRCTTPVSFSSYASRELRKKQTKYHLRKHKLDFNRSLNCHRLSYRKISHKHRISPYILSLNKLYSILYLALLILKDKIQLGDLLRFINEGHLSFNRYSHLLPEDFSDKILNFKNFKKHCTFASDAFRTITSEMANFMDIELYISRPNLVELCERYCSELNLPKDVCDCAKNIISRSGIKMSFRKRGTKVPNYEGRVLCVILFVIKLLFGLDDVTEFHLANFAEILNNSPTVNPKMFNIVKWLKYIEYRKVVLTNNHFPTNYDGDDIKNVQLAINFIAKRQFPEAKYNKEVDKYKQMLNKLKDNLLEPDIKEFPATLTPFLDYIKSLPKENFLDILFEDYTDNSMIYLLRPNEFLKIANKGILPEIINGGANENWKIEELRCVKEERETILKERRKFVSVELTLDKKIKNQEESEERAEIDVDVVKETFQIVNNSKFRKNYKRLEKYFGTLTDFDIDLDKVCDDLDSLDFDYPQHYNPYERFWIRSLMRIEFLSRKDCSNFLEKFPYNFRLIFKECQRIAHQSEEDFLVEYQLTELFLTYFADFKMKNKKKKVNDRLLMNFLERSKDFW